MKRPVLYAVIASLCWNIVLMLSAVANLHWVLNRVNGGLFTSIPARLRFSDFIIANFSAGIIWLAIQLYKKGGAWSRNSFVVSRAVVIAFVLSTMLNLVSKSPTERLNAIPAAIIAYGIFELSGMKRFRRRK